MKGSMLSSWNQVRSAINELRQRCKRLEEAEGIERSKDVVLVKKRISELEDHFASMREAVDFLKTLPAVDDEMEAVDAKFSELHRLFMELKSEINKRFLE